MQSCLTLRCAPLPTARPAPSSRPQRRVAAAAAPKDQQQKPGIDLEGMPVVDRPAEVPTEDFWEGERFQLLGTLASYAIPILVAAAVGIGLFATSTYNEGATVFLDAPKSDADSAKLIPAERLMRAQE